MMDLDGHLLDVGTIIDCACVGQVDYHDPSQWGVGKTKIQSLR